MARSMPKLVYYLTLVTAISSHAIVPTCSSNGASACRTLLTTSTVSSAEHAQTSPTLSLKRGSDESDKEDGWFSDDEFPFERFSNDKFDRTVIPSFEKHYHVGAYRYADVKYRDWIFVSGPASSVPNDTPLAMKRYLIEEGVPSPVHHVKFYGGPNWITRIGMGDGAENMDLSTFRIAMGLISVHYAETAHGTAHVVLPKGASILHPYGGLPKDLDAYEIKGPRTTARTSFEDEDNGFVKVTGYWELFEIWILTTSEKVDKIVRYHYDPSEEVLEDRIKLEGTIWRKGDPPIGTPPDLEAFPTYIRHLNYNL